MPVPREVAITFLQANGALGMLLIDRAPDQSDCTGHEVKYQAKVVGITGLSKPALLGILKRSLAAYEAQLERGDYFDDGEADDG